MGQVYRATDTQLGRDVALKVLPDAFAADPDRLAFQREAQVLASLNHPNIAQIHGLEEADGITVLVLELVEGPTLTGSPKVPFPLTKRCRSRVLTSPPHRRVQQRHPVAGWPGFPPPRWSKFCSALDKPSHTPPPFARISFLAAVYKLKRHCLVGSAGIVLVLLYLLAGGQLNRLQKMEKLR